MFIIHNKINIKKVAKSTKMDINVRIISAVEKETVLYDLNHPHNKCSEVIRAAWAKVADSVGADQKTCHEYWSKLRVRYRIKIFPKKKERQSTRGRQEVPFPYTELMMFLKEHIKPRKARQNYPLFKIAKETPAAIRRFIKMVKEFPILYDESDPDFKRPVKVKASWQHIAEKFNSDAESCVETWSMLRRRYRVRIIQNDPKHYQANVCFPYMKDLEFLRDNIVCRNPYSSENSNNLSIKLIRAISYQPIIYHKNHLASNDKLDEAWQNVANKIGLDDVQTCKKKWEVLKRNYLSNTNLNSNILNEMDFLKEHLSESIDIKMEEVEEATIGESDDEDEQFQDPSTTSNEEHERLIIEAVREEPILYENIRTAAAVIEEAWSRVSLKVGTDISACTIIWRNLRRKFYEKEVMKPKAKFSSRGRKKVPFPHSKAMGFLRKHIKSRRSTRWKHLETTPESPTDIEIQCEEQERESSEDIVEDPFSECKKEIELDDNDIPIESKTDDDKEFFVTVCRLCFSGKDISNYLFASESSDDDKISKIYECTGIRLCKEVDTPSPICRTCDEKLEDLWQFRTLCVVNDKMYKSRQLNKQPLPCAVVEIKEEPHEFQENFMECEKKIDDEMKNQNTSDNENEVFVEPEADLKCDICGNVYKNNSTLQFHVTFVHLGIRTIPPALQAAPKLPVNKKRKPTQSLICHICGKVSRSKAGLKAHTEAVHLKLKQHECSICGLKFAQKTNLFIHIRIHNKDYRFACELCGKKTITSSELKTHMVSHSDSRNQNCNFCQYVAKTKNALNNHVKRVHWKEKNFECKTCGKMFRSGRSRDVHVRSQHTKERPFKCSYCSKNFASEEYMIVHERIHTGACPVKCRICGMGFRQGVSRLNHEKKCRKEHAAEIENNV